MYKLIASDLDETLLNSQKHVSKQDIESISTLLDTKFVLATGRGVYSISNTLKELGFYNKKDQYVISYNGGVITENNDSKPLFIKPLSFSDVEYLFNLGLKYNVCIQLCTLDGVYTYRLFQDEIDYIKGAIVYRELNNTDISFIKNETVLKVLFNINDMEYLRQIRKEINLEDKYSISFSAMRYLEINPKGVNKGFGLKQLCDILNIDIKDTIAVGDNTNDLDMILAAGLGVGVNNVIKDIKKDCDYILDNDNNHSPITELINKFIKNA